VWRASVFVADEETTVRRYAHCEDGAHGFYFHVMKTKLAKADALEVMRDFRDQPDSELSTKRCLERLVIAGTPESVADQILEFRNEVGAFGTLLYTGHDWTDPALARRSMELMANEVWPRIDRAVRGTTPRTGGTVCAD
jgi:alkanesulfonate monooxygenase SsuD/methylene tetrahydromethanopterin reductase-like flavin-dependent oxidoreductase (luciferase family)